MVLPRMHGKAGGGNLDATASSSSRRAMQISMRIIHFLPLVLSHLTAFTQSLWSLNTGDSPAQAISTRGNQQ